ncbi:hypothetical protein E5344_09600 [Microbacterium laevaniformans]|uniref:Uncharacterized protein n=1 Tax=Microbacterium laevaniformans TaxID=36807 RepID=A0A4S2D8P2_9MICO|nr:hypothetical protein E5344_09600 [Microbacterium laevaniformans]
MSLRVLRWTRNGSETGRGRHGRDAEATASRPRCHAAGVTSCCSRPGCR